jgi:hypothetical protein
MDTRFDPAGGLGPAGGAATGFADNAPVGVTNPLVAEILAARNAGLAPGMDVNLDPMAGAAINSQVIPIAPNMNQSFNPALGESVNSQVIPVGPGQDVSFTPEGTAITPVSNVLPSNEQGLTYTPPAAAQRGPDVDPDVIQAMYRNQEMTQAEALRLALLAQQAEAARMQAANNIPTNTLENIMNDIVLESNTGNNLRPVSNTQVIPTAPDMDIRFDPTIDPLTGEVLSPEITKYTPKAKRVLPTIDGVVMETNSNVALNPPVTTAVTTGSTLNQNPVLETNNLFPVSPVVPEIVIPEDEKINIPTFPDDTSGDDDDIVPPDDNGNCPPGYIMKFINGMYVCVPIEEDVAEEEEEEEEVVTYGRPRAGSYYQPRTVAPISPYILNSDEV